MESQVEVAFSPIRAEAPTDQGLTGGHWPFSYVLGRRGKPCSASEMCRQIRIRGHENRPIGDDYPERSAAAPIPSISGVKV